VKKFLLVALILGVLGFQGYKVLDRKADERNARERVSLMFERMKSGSLPDEQDAIGYWHVGHPETASTETANGFARFRAQRNVGRVETYSIVSTQVSEGGIAASRYVDIVCVVNGRDLKIRAVHKFPLEWID
jgi:hypothetical protein